MIPDKFHGIQLSEVHGMIKNLDPNILLEKQHTDPIKVNAEKQHVGEGRAGMRGRRPSTINQTIIQPSELSQTILGATKIETRIKNCANSTAPMHSINIANEGMTHTRPSIPDVPFYPDLTYQPPPKQIRSPMAGCHEGSQSSNSSEITNMDLGVNLYLRKILHYRKVSFQKLTKDLISCSFRNLSN